jgi:hypothetical protein
MDECSGFHEDSGGSLDSPRFLHHLKHFAKGFGFKDLEFRLQLLSFGFQF